MLPRKIISILGFLAIILCACTYNESSTGTEYYKGQSLNIAVIGEFPKVREKQISFHTITLDDLQKQNLNLYDAVFIMQDKLPQAANKKYRNIYLESRVPFFFVESKASILPFIDNSLTYQEYTKRVADNEHYINGLLGTGDDKYKTWKYGYFVENGKLDTKNVKDIYSRVFETIKEEKF